jgi:1-aminocyclopropane-1-carboxylate deaminase/D-cysteine desulfhydrase-like pyridoxal-dependent ACC family enzyme
MMIHTDPVRIENIMPEENSPDGVAIDVLRLDLVHPVISGNKWFKLHRHLEEAMRLEKKKILTWGGAWSNHIAATAFACRELGLACQLIIRGERPAVFSSTLKYVSDLGAELIFISREEYSGKIIPSFIETSGLYCIREGGRSELGVSGAAEICDLFDLPDYTHLICAAGTGTMAAGILRRLGQQQELIVIPVLKGHDGMEQEIRKLSGPHKAKLQVVHDYHFGGYAKTSSLLFDYMNTLFLEKHIPTDFVYTGKLFYAVEKIHANGKFPEQSRVLAIHSGGLQGNESLEKGTLIF